MPTVSYSLEARSSLAQTIKADSDAMRNLATTSATSFKELTAGLNASTRAAREMRMETQSLERQSRSATTGSDGLWKSIAGGTAIGSLAATAIREVGGAVLDMGKNALSLAGDFEQSQISFTTFLGSAATMKTFLADLQQFANVSPFTFTDLQADAKYLLAMGTAGDQVLPVLKDVSAAVAASGGGADALGRVSQAYAKINAEGKTSAIYLNELTRDGVPAWNMLAESMGLTVAQVRVMAREGKITSAIFDEAFHTYTVEHYGNMLAQQSRTLKGLGSTIEDVGGQFARALGGPVIAAIEPELAHLTDELTKPEVTATLKDWGDKVGRLATLATTAWDTFAAGARQALDTVRPLTDLIGQLLGSLPQGATMADPVAPAAKSTADLREYTDEAATAASGYKDQIAAAADVLSGMRQQDQDRNYALTTQIDAERQKLSLLERQYQVQDRATSIDRLKAKIARDEQLAKNVYSAPGQAAGARLVDERQQLEDMLTAQGREGEKARIQDKIQGLETSKKAEDHSAQLRERAQQDEIDRLRKLEAAAKAGAGTIVKANQDMAAATAYYGAEYATTDGTVKAGLGTEQQHVSLLDELARHLRENKPLMDAVADAQREWNKLTSDAGPLFKSIGDSLGKIADSLGLNETAWKDVKTEATKFLDLLVLGMPSALIKIGGELQALADNLKLVADMAKLGRVEMGLLTGASTLQDVYNLTQQIDADQKIATQHTQANAKAYNESIGKAAAGVNTLQAGGGQQPGTHTPGVASGGSIGQTAPSTGYPGYPGYATGGAYPGGQVAVVGEHGPELFFSQHGGQIVPLPAGGGGGDLGTLTVEHLCPACLVKTVEQTIVRRKDLVGQALGQHIRGSRRL